MRKADLVDAIVAATGAGARTGDGEAPTTRRSRAKIRSTAGLGRRRPRRVARRGGERARAAPTRRRRDALIRPAAPSGARRATTATHRPPRPTPARRPHGAAPATATTARRRHGRRPTTSARRDDRRPRRSRRRRRATTPATATASTAAPRRRPTGESATARRRRRGAAASGQRVAATSRASPTSFSGELIDVEGLLDLRDEGYGFLRTTRLPRRPQRRVRLGVAGAPLRAAQGRLREGRDAARPRAARSTRRSCAST